MGNLTTQATVLDIVSEFNGTPLAGPGPFTMFNVGGVTSGQIYDKITEANAYLQSTVGIGSTTPADAAQKEMIKRFEVSWGSARLAGDLIGINITDAFNYSVAGVAVQRANPQFQNFQKFIADHLLVAKSYSNALMAWFYVYNPVNPLGVNERGTPVSYWSVSQGRLG